MEATNGQKKRIQRVTPFLWFKDSAEEAADFYQSIFNDAHKLDERKWVDGAPKEYKKGSVMSVTFEIDGVQFTAFNGGPHFTLNMAFSMFVHCKDQKEVDYYWDRLLEGGGKPSQCGWLTDRFGLSWQVVPEALGRLLSDPDPQRAKRAMQCMMEMIKLDVAQLEAAADAA